MFLAMSRLAIPEGIMRFTRALVEDVSVRSWFLSLERLPESKRRAAFIRMAEEMTSGGEKAQLIVAASFLVRPEVYAAVLKSVRECCGL